MLTIMVTLMPRHVHYEALGAFQFSTFYKFKVVDCIWFFVTKWENKFFFFFFIMRNQNFGQKLALYQ